jgi:hypothetical protein
MGNSILSIQLKDGLQFSIKVQNAGWLGKAGTEARPTKNCQEASRDIQQPIEFIDYLG